MKPIVTLAIPHDSVSDEVVTIISISNCDGEYVASGDVILEYETSKSVVSLEAPIDGYVAYGCVENETIPIGKVVAGIFSHWDDRAVREWKTLLLNLIEVTMNSWIKTEGTAETQYSVRAESLIAEHDLDKKLFIGRDFVSVQDVEKFLPPKSLAPTSSSRKSALGDRERVVVVCANKISAEMIEDIFHEDDSKVLVGYVVDSAFRQHAELYYLDTEVFEFPKKISRTEFDTVVIAMGGSLKSMRFRKKVFDHYRALDVPFTNLISKSANISSGVELGVGNIIEGNVYVAPYARIMDNNFISYATVIGHHSVIGSHNLFAPGVTMAGLVRIGDECIFPTGVNFIDQIKVGNRVILPVGYNVCSNLEDDAVIKMREKN